MEILFLIYLFFANVIFAFEDNFVYVTTTFGVVKGLEKQNSFNGKTYYSFQGIPYAKPPVGELRFREPQKIERYNEDKNCKDVVIDATKEGAICSQINLGFKLVGCEDCLVLNIYSQTSPVDLIKNLKKLPVMIYVHGGGFEQGSGSTDLYGPEYLIPNDVVLVTFNYRLGIFGFLSNNNQNLNMSNNNSLKDQTMCFKWVNENIHFFGGDNERITIFGQSSGSASVNLHTLSPMSKGLFHGAIMQSGVSYDLWEFFPYNFELISNITGCNKTNKDTEKLKCLKQLPKNKILKKHLELMEREKEFAVVGPVLEKYSKKNEKNLFICKPPKEIIQNKEFAKVPYIIGGVKDDGDVAMVALLGKVNLSDNALYVPEDLKLRINNSEKIDQLGQRIKEHYFNHTDPKTVNNQTLVKFFKLVTAIGFSYKSYVEVSDYSKYKTTTPTFYYHFIYKSKLNYSPKFISHQDDVSYLFKPKNQVPLKENSTEYNGVKLMTKLWTNFAKSGSPNHPKAFEPFWKPIEQNKIYTLFISENSTLVVNPFKKTRAFWDDIYLKKTTEKSTTNNENDFFNEFFNFFKKYNLLYNLYQEFSNDKIDVKTFCNFLKHIDFTIDFNAVHVCNKFN